MYTELICCSASCVSRSRPDSPFSSISEARRSPSPLAVEGGGGEDDGAMWGDGGSEPSSAEASSRDDRPRDVLLARRRSSMEEGRCV